MGNNTYFNTWKLECLEVVRFTQLIKLMKWR